MENELENFTVHISISISDHRETVGLIKKMEIPQPIGKFQVIAIPFRLLYAYDACPIKRKKKNSRSLIHIYI